MEFNNIVILIISIFAVLFIVMFIILFNFIGKYKKFMNGVKGNKNIEELLIEYVNEINMIKNKTNEIENRLIYLENNIKSCFQKIGVERYNALPDMGNNMSYSVAILDKNNDGVIFTGIFTREYSQNYAKPVIDGKTDRVLSDEERKALKVAIEKSL